MRIAVTVCLLVLTAVAATRKPNVLLIFSDDQGYAEAGCYGLTDIPTPFLDSLASQGARFTDGYVTAPVCSPSRAGLLTGRYQQRFGHEHNPGNSREAGLPTTETTMADRHEERGMPNDKRPMVVTIEALVDLRLLALPDRVVVRSRNFREKGRFRPTYRDDPRYEVRLMVLETLARAARTLACKGAAKKLPREIERARAGGK
jgi:hypothetical protein